MAEWQFAGFALEWLPAEYASNSAPRGRKAEVFLEHDVPRMAEAVHEQAAEQYWAVLDLWQAIQSAFSCCCTPVVD